MLRAEELTPTDLLEVIWRQRFALVAFALVGASLAYGYALFVPDRYTAETLVLVEDAELPRDYVQSASTVSLRARLDTLKEQVLSRTRLEALVRQYELASPGGSLELAVSKVRRRIGIEVIGTDGFRLTYTDEDPRMAARLANALAGFFIAESTDALDRQVRSTASGIQQQTDDLKQQLSVKEAEIAAFKSANLGMLPEQLGDNLDAAQTLRQQIRDNGARLTVVRGQLAALPQPVAASEAVTRTTSAQELARTILASATAEGLGARLASEHPLVGLEARRLQRQSLLRRYTERHPDVRQVDAEIAALEQLVASSAPYVPTSTVVAGAPRTMAVPANDRAALESEISSLETARNSMLNDVAEYDRRVAGAPAVEQQMRVLEREHDTLLRNYIDLANRNVEADLANDLQTADMPKSRFRVVDAAVVPDQPSSPLRMFFLLGGALVGIALVCGATFLREVAMEPVNSAAELERFGGLDVLASIPVVRTASLVRRQRLIRVGSVAAVGSVLVVVFVLRVMVRGL